MKLQSIQLTNNHQVNPGTTNKAKINTSVLAFGAEDQVSIGNQEEWVRQYNTLTQGQQKQVQLAIIEKFTQQLPDISSEDVLKNIVASAEAVQSNRDGFQGIQVLLGNKNYYMYKSIKEDNQHQYMIRPVNKLGKTSVEIVLDKSDNGVVVLNYSLANANFTFELGKYVTNQEPLQKIRNYIETLDKAGLFNKELPLITQLLNKFDEIFG